MNRTWARMPAHVLRDCGTSRAFKAEKRRELRALHKALETFRYGCAFVPEGSGLVRQIENAIISLHNSMRVVNWGR